MKKLVFPSLLLFIGSLAGCYKTGHPLAQNDYVFVNQSEHVIALTIPAIFLYGRENPVLLPGDSFELFYDAEGGVVTSPGEYIGIMTVVFDEETKVIYVSPTSPEERRDPSMIYDKPYNPLWGDNSVFEKMAKNEFRWTYTFTNADYDAAVAYTQAQGGE